MRDTAAIIVAGGKGLRYGGRIRKQYLTLRGRPLIWWSVKSFLESPSIADIVLVVPAHDVPLKSSAQRHEWIPRQNPRGMTIRIVAGGATRADSVRAGLVAIRPDCRYVAVHDAVRPLVTSSLIETVIQAARKTGAALAATPSKDTVKIADARGMVANSPARDRVWLAQTPQIFERRLLERAHAAGHRQAVTDDSQLVERLGIRVKLVPSAYENIKVTVPMDLVVADKVLGARR